MGRSLLRGLRRGLEREGATGKIYPYTIPPHRIKITDTICLLFRLTLAVINGNPAKRLYSRLGFVDDKEDFVDRAFGCCFVAIFFGRPYGCADRHVGSTNMTKMLKGNGTGEEPPRVMVRN